MHYFVRSEDGQDYSVGRWDGEGRWVPGTREDAVREARLLRQPCLEDGSTEPTAYAWGKTTHAYLDTML